MKKNPITKKYKSGKITPRMLHAIFSTRIITFPCIIFILFLTGCAAFPAANPDINKKTHKEDSWFTHDKYAHFLVSGAVSAGLAKAAKDNGKDNCDAALIGFGITLSFGAAKESYDKRKKKTLYSYHDMVWNAAGSAIGSLAASNCL